MCWSTAGSHIGQSRLWECLYRSVCTAEGSIFQLWTCPPSNYPKDVEVSGRAVALWEFHFLIISPWFLLLLKLTERCGLHAMYVPTYRAVPDIPMWTQVSVCFKCSTWSCASSHLICSKRFHLHTANNTHRHDKLPRQRNRVSSESEISFQLYPIQQWAKNSQSSHCTEDAFSDIARESPSTQTS